MHKILKLTFAAVFVALSACGGGATTAASPASGAELPSGSASAPSSPGVVTTIQGAIAKALASGDLPALNHDNTLSGPDVDRNGVRDDIDAYINALPDSSEQKTALIQNAKALGATLTVDTTDKAALLIVSDGIANAGDCIFSLYPDITPAYNKSREIEKITVNTKLRFVAYEKFNRAMSGSVLDGPPLGTGCGK